MKETHVPQNIYTGPTARVRIDIQTSEETPMFRDVKLELGDPTKKPN